MREWVAAKLQAIRELVDERDRLYKERDAAIREQTKATFEASDKAITKAEDAQRDYNVRSNEFRGQLDDQNKLMRDTMMPRVESLGMHHATADKIEAVKRDTYSRVDSVTAVFDKEVERLSDDIKVLREAHAAQSGKSSVADPFVGEALKALTLQVKSLSESRMEGSGRSAGSHAMWGYVLAALGVISTLFGLAVVLMKMGAP